MNALQIYQKYVPAHIFTPSCFQMDLIEQIATNLEVWDATCLYWIGNSYRVQSIQKMLVYYEERIAEQSQARWQDVGKYDASHISEPTTFCAYCKSDYCLSNHEDERRAN